ncbi:MAG: glycosyl hydrolase family 65 protein [Anaerolineae bacterium]
MTRLWELNEGFFNSARINHFETLFTVGNGYLGTRGTFEEGYPGNIASTLVHGIYDHAPRMLVPELANAPNWIPVAITIDGTPFQLSTTTDDFMRPSAGVIFGYERTLDLKRGVLTRSVLFRAASGNVVRLIFERFASLHNVHLLAQRVQVVAVDGNPSIRLHAYLDAEVMNSTGKHWAAPEPNYSNGTGFGLSATTLQSQYRLAMVSRLTGPGSIVPSPHPTQPGAKAEFTLKQEESVTFDKLTAIFTSRDTETPLDAARTALGQATSAGYDALLEAHAGEWAAYWRDSDIVIEGDDDLQAAIRFTTYHILIAAPRHDEHVSIGAKTLSGFGYKGHVFWDTELFVLPVLTLTQPRLSRNLLMYRYHNLTGARHKAKTNGFEGAMYPWESTDTGEETTPQWGDPLPDGSRIRIWTGDNEQHVSTDIAYATYQFWRWTGDDAFFTQCGAELILDTAVFWGSRVEDKGDRYEISQQIGPDEYHENIDNSVFVNRMVVWHLQTAIDVLAWLRQHAPADAVRLASALDLSETRLAKWRDIIARMYIPFDAEKQIHIQFPGFFAMEYIPVEHYQPRITSVQAILGHPRTIQSQVIKQADVVALMALLDTQFDVPAGSDRHTVMLNNWNTYYPRTDHGSSLSPAMHALQAARMGLNDLAYHEFDHAAHIDLEDNKGNARDGIHAAACGGVWQAVVLGFCGLHISPSGELATRPNLPAHWKRVSFTVHYRGERRAITVGHPEGSPMA